MHSNMTRQAPLVYVARGPCCLPLVGETVMPPWWDEQKKTCTTATECKRPEPSGKKPPRTMERPRCIANTHQHEESTAIGCIDFFAALRQKRTVCAERGARLSRLLCMWEPAY